MIAQVGLAFRALHRRPAVALCAILAIGLGIGAAATIFSLIDGVLLRPLPLTDPNRLVNIWDRIPARNVPQMVVAPGNYYDIRARAHSFAAMGAYQQATFNLERRDAEPERFLGAICDAGFFTALGASPV